MRHHNTRTPPPPGSLFAPPRNTYALALPCPTPHTQVTQNGLAVVLDLAAGAFVKAGPLIEIAAGECAGRVGDEEGAVVLDLAAGAFVKAGPLIKIAAGGMTQGASGVEQLLSRSLGWSLRGRPEVGGTRRHTQVKLRCVTTCVWRRGAEHTHHCCTRTARAPAAAPVRAPELPQAPQRGRAARRHACLLATVPQLPRTLPPRAGAAGRARLD